jgi:hypothetical protein
MKSGCQKERSKETTSNKHFHANWSQTGYGKWERIDLGMIHFCP